VFERAATKRLILAAEPMALERPRQGGAEGRHIDRFGEVVGRTSGDRIHGHSRIGKCRDEHHGGLGRGLPCGLEELHAACARHLHV
jgi:hypothetical protein